MLLQVVNFGTNWEGKGLIGKLPKLSKDVVNFQQESGIPELFGYSYSNFFLKVCETENARSGTWTTLGQRLGHTWPHHPPTNPPKNYNPHFRVDSSYTVMDF